MKNGFINNSANVEGWKKSGKQRKLQLLWRRLLRPSILSLSFLLTTCANTLLLYCAILIRTGMLETSELPSLISCLIPMYLGWNTTTTSLRDRDSCCYGTLKERVFLEHGLLISFGFDRDGLETHTTKRVDTRNATSE